MRGFYPSLSSGSPSQIRASVRDPRSHSPLHPLLHAHHSPLSRPAGSAPYTDLNTCPEFLSPGTAPALRPWHLSAGQLLLPLPLPLPAPYPVASHCVGQVPLILSPSFQLPSPKCRSWLWTVVHALASTGNILSPGLCLRHAAAILLLSQPFSPAVLQAPSKQIQLCAPPAQHRAWHTLDTGEEDNQEGRHLLTSERQPPSLHPTGAFWNLSHQVAFHLSPAVPSQT